LFFVRKFQNVSLLLNKSNVLIGSMDIELDQLQTNHNPPISYYVLITNVMHGKSGNRYGHFSKRLILALFSMFLSRSRSRSHSLSLTLSYSLLLSLSLFLSLSFFCCRTIHRRRNLYGLLLPHTLGCFGRTCQISMIFLNLRPFV
jgi:hypothetical protein